MSVQPDSHAWPRAVGILVWSVYFLALAATFLVAGYRGDRGTQQAAAWGLAAAVAVVVIGLPALTATWTQVDPAGLRLAYLLVLLGSTLLIIMSMSLTMARHPAGAWVLVPPLVASPVAGWLMNRAGSRPRRRRWGRVKERLRRRPPALLSTGWEHRLERSGLAVALEAGFWADARRNLDPESHEQGGVALIARAGTTMLVLGAVFPPQRRANAVACEFPAAEVDRVRQAINTVGPDIGVVRGTIKVTWVHTHPRLGVFLSGTDVATSQMWRGLDPDFTPIVIDISRDALPEAIGVFDGDGRQIQPMSTAPGMIHPGAAARLRAALAAAYDDAGTAAPVILLGDIAEPARGRSHVHRR
ncbi:hypothetical protein Ait01nite_082510 [Actinoplanes italicus]|uniref:Uncharacterized protein n=1 Tax=Actinoplanes italicus TaxID=113567 RepID=A0A2T0K2Z3_9ACTN|nr:hypothetical protein [Actinoplanes italicus]PRX17236.1 hypothetical protein CLV67_11612 [Actinoplanes italicus]GIE35206.1 hypothetical protein Ait01nite_082510 [Actinoplanes italicus]